MTVLSFDTAAEFGRASRDWLALSERRNSLILSILHRTTKTRENVRGWLVSSDSGPELALLQTPLQPAILSDGKLEAAQWAARCTPADLPGIVGPAVLADNFSSEWCACNSGAAHLHWETTFYTLEHVEPFPHPGGILRRATPADLEDLRQLVMAAARDMNLPQSEQNPEELEKRLQRNIEGGRQFVWREGSSIRAIASYAEALEDAGARIGLVYTRPELRGRGYGTAITGSLAQLLLNEKQAWVSLFADNANPASNRIYRRLGFREELVYRTWLFTPGTGGSKK